MHRILAPTVNSYTAYQVKALFLLISVSTDIAMLHNSFALPLSLSLPHALFLCVSHHPRRLFWTTANCLHATNLSSVCCVLLLLFVFYVFLWPGDKTPKKVSDFVSLAMLCLLVGLGHNGPPRATRATRATGRAGQVTNCRPKSHRLVKTVPLYIAQSLTVAQFHSCSVAQLIVSSGFAY